MFTIKPAVPEDYYDIKEIYAKYGKELLLSAEKNIMVARDNVFSGIGVFEIKGSCAEFSDILTNDQNDERLKYFIAKAVLNSIDLKGITDVYSVSDYIEPTLRKCGFKYTDGKFTLNLDGYFSVCGKHEK